jgi:hypothetical protein
MARISKDAATVAAHVAKRVNVHRACGHFVAWNAEVVWNRYGNGDFTTIIAFAFVDDDGKVNRFHFAVNDYRPTVTPHIMRTVRYAVKTITECTGQPATVI